MGRLTAKLVPNSELVLLEGGHFLPIEHPDRFAALVSSFLD